MFSSSVIVRCHLEFCQSAPLQQWQAGRRSQSPILLPRICRDAEDAARGRDGYDFYGSKLRVEIARGGGPPMGGGYGPPPAYGGGGGGGYGRGPPPAYGYGLKSGSPPAWPLLSLCKLCELINVRNPYF